MLKFVNVLLLHMQGWLVHLATWLIQTTHGFSISIGETQNNQAI